MSQQSLKFTIQTRSKSRQEELGSLLEKSDEPRSNSEDLGELAQPLDFNSSVGLSESGSISIPTSPVSQEASGEGEDRKVEAERQREDNSHASPINRDDPGRQPAMAEGRAPIITPTKFRGTGEESVEDYLKTFERSAKANGWDEAKKVVLIPCFLEGAVLKWFENLEQREGDNLTWAIVKAGMREAFQPIAYDEQLEYRLRMRMQGEDEAVEAYLQDIINLCSKVDPDMAERSKVKHVLRGLKPTLLEKVMVMDNATLSQLQTNIRKVQTARFMAGQRIDNIMAEPIGGAGPSSGRADIPQFSTVNPSTSLESKIENLTSEFAKINMRLLEQRQTSQEPVRHSRGRTPDFRGEPQRGRGPWRGQYRGNNRGRTSDGRVICYKCHRVGHFAVACRSSNQGNEEERR